VPWLLVDLAVPLLAVLLLVLAGAKLWKGLKGLFRAAREAGEKVGPASDALAAAQGATPAGGANAGVTPSEERT
jgi:hypothetical protein